MKATKWILMGFMLVALVVIAGCNEGNARKNDMMGDSMTGMDRVEWKQGLTGFQHPVVLYP
jgi:hypothetical protein